MRTHLSKTYSLAVWFALAANSYGVPNLVVVPPVVGNSSTEAPFGILPPLEPSMRYQQVYSSWWFSRTSPEGMWITAVRFDIDDAAGSGLFARIPEIQINLSTTSHQPDALSLTFSENVGLDDTTVIARGPLTLSGPGSGHGFDIIIPLQTPFLYRPANGNLLLDVRNFQPANPQLFPISPFDAEIRLGDDVSRIFALSVTATTASYPDDSGGLVTGFDFTPVPEPTVLPLLGLAAGLVGFWKLGRKLGRKQACH